MWGDRDVVGLRVGGEQSPFRDPAGPGQIWNEQSGTIAPTAPPPHPERSCPQIGLYSHLQFVSHPIHPSSVRCFGGKGKCLYRRDLNSSTERPASLAIPRIVKALTGLLRGMVRKRPPSDITTCFLPSRTIRNPALRSARTAARWLTPGIEGIGHTGTSTSRTFSVRVISSTAARYSSIASVMFWRASSSVSPCDQHPGRPGQ